MKVTMEDKDIIRKLPDDLIHQVLSLVDTQLVSRNDGISLDYSSVS